MADRPTLVARIPETGTRSCVRKRRLASSTRHTKPIACRPCVTNFRARRTDRVRVVGRAVRPRKRRNRSDGE
ncbi:unnamed protein product [Symbiodinium microadriaticum]|nr:unnamed protein product [Symbiodinium microadriaticum]